MSKVKFLDKKTMITKQFWIRASGIFGILGGLTLFAGDMLFYYSTDSINLNANMGNASDFRIITSGVTALLAAWFYVLGVGQVYHAFQPSKLIYRTIVTCCLGAIVIAYGVIHGAFIGIATSAKLAIEYDLNLDKSVNLARKANEILRLFVYPIFALLSVFFIVLVWNKQTHYPKWILLFFPLLPFLIRDLICDNLPQTYWVIVCGGYLNLILIVFFTASTIALWKSPGKT